MSWHACYCRWHAPSSHAPVPPSRSITHLPLPRSSHSAASCALQLEISQEAAAAECASLSAQLAQVTAAAAAASSKARGDQLVLAKEVKRLREELAAAKQVCVRGQRLKDSCRQTQGCYVWEGAEGGASVKRCGMPLHKEYYMQRAGKRRSYQFRLHRVVLYGARGGGGDQLVLAKR